MTTAPSRTPARVPCVGAVVHDSAQRLLVVLRRNPPDAGRWSIPGGRVDPGEDPLVAVRREVLEETGLQVEVQRLLGVVDMPGIVPTEGGPRSVYVASDFLCSLVGEPTPHPGDDAMAAAWVTRDELEGLDLVPGLATTLGQWAVLPR